MMPYSLRTLTIIILTMMLSLMVGPANAVTLADIRANKLPPVASAEFADLCYVASTLLAEDRPSSEVYPASREYWINEALERHGRSAEDLSVHLRALQPMTSLVRQLTEKERFGIFTYCTLEVANVVNAEHDEEKKSKAGQP